MTEDRHIWVLLDAIEEAGMKLAEASDEVRRMLSDRPATPTTDDTLNRKLKTHIAHDESKRRPRHPMAKSRYNRPTPHDQFPNYFHQYGMPCPTDRDAVIGMAYDERGRTILSEFHKAVEWQESDLRDLIPRLTLEEPTKIVVFGDCRFVPEHGSVGRLQSAQAVTPIVFSGFDKCSRISDFFVSDSIGNMLFEDLTLKNFHVNRAERVVFENCLIDGSFVMGRGPDSCKEVQFRFCEFTEESDVVLAYPQAALFEFCHFHRQNQIHFTGVPDRLCETIGTHFGEAQLALRQA